MIGARLKGVIIPPDSVPIPFLYNPSEIPETRTVNYAEKEAPGPSHPGIQYVSGKGRELSFTLEAHNPFWWRGTRLPISLELYAESLYQLTLPTYVAGELTQGPPTVLLIVGAMARSVKIKSLTTTSKLWTPLLVLKHLEIQISMVEVAEESHSRTFAWSS